LGDEGIEEGSDAFPGCFDGSFVGLSEQCFELGKDLFDGVEIGAVGRQEDELGTGAADGLADGLAFVAAQVVHDDDIARAERWHQELLDIGEEGLAVDGAVEHAGRVDPFMAERSEEGQRLPFTVWHLGHEPLPARRTAVRAGHVGLGPGLVDEDEPLGVKPALILFPLRPPARDPRTILLAGEQAFF
jgi:hypothetical protein